ATVDYRPVVTSPAEIQEAIRRMGYTPVVSVTNADKVPAAEDRQAAAYQKVQVRFYVAAALTVPVMVLGMSDHLGLPIGASPSAWVQLLLTAPILFWA